MPGRLEKQIRLDVLEAQVQIPNDKRTRRRYKYGFVTEQEICLDWM